MNNEPNNHHGTESHVVVRRRIPVTTIHKMCLMNTWINMSAFKQIFAIFATSSFSNAFFFGASLKQFLSSSSLDLN